MLFDQCFGFLSALGNVYKGQNNNNNNKLIKANPKLLTVSKIAKINSIERKLYTGACENMAALLTSDKLNQKSEGVNEND